MRKQAFVTGGTGFIGINLIHLLLERGWNVTALHRPSSDLRHLSGLPARLRAGSVTDIQSLYDAIPEKTDAVFHLAGDTSLWSSRDRIQTKINVEGTRNVLEVAAARNSKAFIHTSSASAWGQISDCEITEKLPQNGMKSWVNYERTKWVSEQEVLKYFESGMKVVILNPTTVTGPFDLHNWGKLFFALKNGQLPGVPDGTVSVTHVREVVKAHIEAVDRGKNGSRYILSGEDCSIEGFVTEIASVLGINSVPRKIPNFYLKITAYLQTTVSAITGREPTLTPELVKILTRRNISYSSDKAASQLGYRTIPMKKSVRDCYNWLNGEGYL